MSAAQDTDHARALLAVVEARAKPEVWEWLLAGVPAGEPLQRGAFFGRYASAGRRLAAPQPVLTGAERAGLLAIGVEVPEVFSLGDLARAALLCQAFAASEPGEHVALLTELFRKGDNAERIALLRALPLLPQPERFVALAVDACRTTRARRVRSDRLREPVPRAPLSRAELQPAGAESRSSPGSRSRVSSASTRRRTPELAPHGGRLRGRAPRRRTHRCRDDRVDSCYGGRRHEAVRSPHPHDVAHHRRLRGDGRRRHRRDRRAGVLARPAAHPRRHVRGLLPVARSAGSAFARASSASATSARSR